MDDARDKHLAALARTRHGVFTAGDAARVGISPSALQRRTERGRYDQLHPGVYGIGGAPATVRRDIVAAVLSIGRIAAASHQTAAELWGLTDRGLRTIEVVTRRWRRVHRPAFTVHESLDLVAADIEICDGIPTTSPVRTVVDLGASNKWLVEAALGTGIRKGLFTVADVERFVKRVARRGRRGVGVIRPLLAARRRWDAATESALEDRFMTVIDDAGLPQPIAQWVVRDVDGTHVGRADFAYPEARVLIELDGEAFHIDRVAFRHDRARQNRMSLLGWQVLRYTWWDVVDQPHRVVSEIRRALRRSGVPSVPA